MMIEAAFGGATAGLFKGGQKLWSGLKGSNPADDIFWANQQKVNQAARRGWLIDDVEAVRNYPTLIRSSPDIVNRANNNPVTYYYRPDGHYAVIDDITGQIVQVSNRFDPNWIDEMTNQAIQHITNP